MGTGSLEMDSETKDTFETHKVRNPLAGTLVSKKGPTVTDLYMGRPISTSFVRPYPKYDLDARSYCSIDNNSTPSATLAIVRRMRPTSRAPLFGHAIVLNDNASIVRRMRSATHGQHITHLNDLIVLITDNRRHSTTIGLACYCSLGYSTYRLLGQ